MNIQDVKDTKIPDNIWEEIFNKQLALAIKYRDIEDMGDLLDTLKSNLDTAKGQKWIKDFAWRTTEELTEADEALMLYNLHKDDAMYEHYIEELIDALHFLVELCIVAGYNYTDFDIPETKEYPKVISYDVIYSLGLACNCLKNKPWKQTQMLTDRNKFYLYLDEAFLKLRLLLHGQDLKDKDIYNYYFKKNAVNKFRIRSKY